MRHPAGLRTTALGACVTILGLGLSIVVGYAYATLAQTLGLRQGCRMSRMWPSYIDYTHLVRSPSQLSSKYRVLLYREGYLEPHASQFPPAGLPALFIPGNAGSYGQVRSVASSSARQYWSHDYSPNGDDFHPKPKWSARGGGLDWWTLDFNEDFSAFHGGTLFEQATFVNEVIAFLRETYSGANVTEIPVLAHSMGGIAARLAMALPSYIEHTMQTLVTLSTPHAYPPLPFDRGVESVYSWINQGGENTTLLISLAGGNLDTQVASDPALLTSSFWPPSGSISLSTTALPDLWSSVDHLAILWCDQIRTTLATGFLRTGLPEYRQASLQDRRELWLADFKVGSEVRDLAHGQLDPMATLDQVDLSAWPNRYDISLLTNEDMITAERPAFRVVGCAGQLCNVVPAFRWTMLPSNADASLWHLSINASALKAAGYDLLRVDKREDVDHTWWMLLGSGVTCLDVKGCLGKSLGFQRANMQGLSSSTQVLDVRVRLSACVQKSEALSPLLRVRSLPSSDQVFLRPQDDGTFAARINLVGQSPWLSEQEPVQWILEAWAEPSCNAIFEQVDVSVAKFASLGTLVTRYRTAIVAVPFVLISWMMVQPPEGAWLFFCTACVTDCPFPGSLLTAAPPTVGSVFAALVFAHLSRHIIPASLALSWGAAASGMTLSDLAVVAGLISLIGTTFAVVGSLTVAAMVALLAAVMRRVSALESQPAMSPWTLWSILPAALVSVLVATVVPHQVILFVTFVVQLFTTARARIHKAPNLSNYERQNQTALLIFFWCLPLKGPVLFVWARNLLHGWVARHNKISAGDYNPLEILSFVLLAQLLAAGPSLHMPNAGSGIWATAQRFLLLGALLVGPRRPFLLYDGVNCMIALTLAYQLKPVRPRAVAFEMSPKVAALPLALPESLREEPTDAQRAHLDTVDQYIELRKQMGRELSLAFVHLGKAKTQTGGWLGSRVGRDGLDFRMKALTRMSFDEHGVMHATEVTSGEGDEPVRDPLHQFSALPPPSLRQAQAHFKRALALALGDSNTAPATIQTCIARLQGTV